MKNTTKILFSLIFILSVSSCLYATDEDTIKKKLDEINNNAMTAYKEGRYNDGVAWAEKTYYYAKTNLKAKHPYTVASMNNLGFLYSLQGRFAESESLYKEALRINGEVLGDKHPNTITCMYNLGNLYCSQGKFGKAEPLLKETLLLYKVVLGTKHPETIKSMSSLGVLYQSQGRYVESEPLFKEALLLGEEILGAKHPETINIINNLGALYESQGRYAESEPLIKKALRLHEEVKGYKHPLTLVCMNNLGSMYELQGRYGEAEPLFKEALRLREEVLGAKHPDTIASMNNLGELYHSQGRYDVAEPLYKKALQVSSAVLGHKHPLTLVCMNNLGSMYKSQGRYGEAEPLFKETLQLRKVVLGAKHPFTIASMNNLGELYVSQGRYDESEPLYKNALSIHKEVLGARHPNTISSMNNLGRLFESQGRYGEAGPLFKEALRQSEELLGSKHPNTIASMNNLGGLYESQGRYGEAEPLYKRALRLREDVLGAKHPDTINSMNNLGVLYLSWGRYVEAEQLFKEAMRLNEDIKGAEHPATITCLTNLTVCLINMKKYVNALQLLKKIEQRLLTRSHHLLYSTQKEMVRRKFFNEETNFQDAIFTFASLYDSKELSKFAANVELRWKQIQGEEQAFISKLVQTSNDPRTKKLASKITSIRALLPRSFPIDGNKQGAKTPEMLLEELELAELELADLSREYKENLKVYDVDVQRVRAALPAYGTLIEYKLYKKADFKNGDLGDLHVAAMLITAESDEVCFEKLGPLALLSESSKSENRFKDIYKFLMGRFDGKIKNIKTLYIAPDGVLNLIPFERLITPDGSYLIERKEVRTLQTGRDLLRSRQKSVSNRLVALGGAVYDRYTEGGKPDGQKASKEEAENNMRLKKELSGFEYLPASKEEVDKIGLYYTQSRKAPADQFVGVHASEAALKGLNQSSKILHLSTHGYYLKNSELERERPMALSGLALAGANLGLKGLSDPNGEDGILYAMEILGLNLNGTELVSLSACATGSGVLDYSEGIYGLVRAFRIAGAQSVLMTLKPVKDNDACKFMTAFYKNWMEQKEGAHPATALRKTKLDFINHETVERYREPEFWSPYVLVGK